MAARWSPPEEDSANANRHSIALWMGRDTRVLVGLTLALFCALIFLGSARARTEKILMGETGGSVMVVNAGFDNGTLEPLTEEVEITAESLATLEAESIQTLRLSAQVSEMNGDWASAVDAWKAVLGQSDAGMDDFLALANAQERIGDLSGAGESLTRACNRFPENPKVYIALGGLRERQDNPEAARFQYQVGLSYAPDNPELKTRLESVDRVLNESVDDWPSDWLNNPEIPEAENPRPVENETRPVVVYETQPGEPPVNPVSEPVPIFENTEPEINTMVEEEKKGKSTTGSDNEPLTLIGAVLEEDSEEDTSKEDEDDTGTSDDTESVFTEIQDLRVNASQQQVTIEIITARPVTFSTSRGALAPRLFVRIPDAFIPADSNLARNVTVNIPLVERISIVESSDNNNYISVVVYLDENARHSVAAVGRSLKITITKSG